MHFGLAALIDQFEEGLPAFLYAHSMGCIVTNTFLLRNPGLKIAGVIFSAPFFGMSEANDLNPVKVAAIQLIKPLLEVSNFHINFRGSR